MFEGFFAIPQDRKVHVCIGFSRVYNNKILTFQKVSKGENVTANDIEGWLPGYPKCENGLDYVYAMFGDSENSGKVFNGPSSECYFMCES